MGEGIYGGAAVGGEEDLDLGELVLCEGGGGVCAVYEGGKGALELGYGGGGEGDGGCDGVGERHGACEGRGHVSRPEQHRHRGGYIYAQVDPTARVDPPRASYYRHNIVTCTLSKSGLRHVCECGRRLRLTLHSRPPLQAHQQNAAPFQPAPSPFPVRSSAG